MNHFSPFLNKYFEKRKIIRKGAYDDRYQSSSVRTLGWSLLTGLKIKSSKTEALHLVVATVLVTAVGLSLGSFRHISWQFLPY